MVVPVDPAQLSHGDMVGGLAEAVPVEERRYQVEICHPLMAIMVLGMEEVAAVEQVVGVEQVEQVIKV
jgi:hypothetical protein